MATTQPTNPAVFSPALLRHPIAERTTLLVSQPWARWMQASWGRQGGAAAPSNAELDSGLSGTQDDLSGTQDDLAGVTTRVETLEGKVATLEGKVATLEGKVATLEGKVATLEGKVATLETTVAAQGTRITALEAWRTAVVAGLPMVVVLTAVPALGDDPATAILLENDLTANWRPGINTNDAALQTAVNAVRNALAA